MIRIRPACFTSWHNFRSYIAEVLVVIDAGIAVITLGIVEVNISVVYMTVMQELYGDALWPSQ